MSTYHAETIETSYIQGTLARYGYREYGVEGSSPLLLLNRYRATLDDWDPLLLDLLAAKLRIIILDNVGVGYTDGTAPDTIAEMGLGVIDFLNAKGLGRVHLLGWSMGGFIAQLLAADCPDRFETVTIAGSGPGEPSIRPAESERSIAIRGKAEPEIEDILYLFFPDTDGGRAAGAEVLGRSYNRADGITKEVKKESWLNQNAAIQRWNSGEDSGWNLLPGITTVPLMVANGTQDVMEDVQQTIAMARRIPNGVTAIFADAGHAFLFQHAHRFSQLLVGFTS
ncbi:alpha/beta hydrolase [Arthrobacter sp. NPDC080031]|uniref:alpha/beta fold hydrolase n=1 Tax=Arthrobacter sp. NPDC080031 TaxID=3155918 RepID=UPI00344E43C4